MAGGRIPLSTIEEVKERVDLAELISSCGVPLKAAGGGYVACCPFHNEKTPSFHINTSKNLYHCFGCGKSGTAIDFLMEHEGMDFVEAVKRLGDMCGVTIEEREDPEAGMRRRLYALHGEIAAFFHRCLLKASEAEVARRYIAKRRLDGEAAETFTIGYVPLSSDAILKWAKKYGFTPKELELSGILCPPKRPGGGWYSRFAGRLAFTIRDKQGCVVAFSARNILDPDNKKIAKYINSPETPIFKKSQILFAFDRAAGEIVRAPRREAIVCEGQIDVIRCHMNGFRTAVASQGTSFTEEHAAMLSKNADSVVLVFDGDGAGCKAAVKTAELFLARDIPVRVVSLPKGEDPDSLLLKGGPDAFKSRLDAAESIASFQVKTMRAQEANPGSIDAVHRISKAVMHTLSSCSGSVMRAALVEEAAKLLSLPVSALESDIARLERQPQGRAQAPQRQETAAVPESDLGEDGPPPEFFFGEGDMANAEHVDVPPPREMALCEFLFANTGNADIASMAADCLSDAIVSHAFTRRFVAAWLDEASGTADAMENLRRSLDGGLCAIFDSIILGTDKSGFSELGPERVFCDLVRQLLCDELRRRQLQLPAESTGENDVKRLEYSQKIRSVKAMPWERVVAEIGSL